MNYDGEAALVSLLLADGPLVAVVGDRVSWDAVEPDPDKPFVSLRLISGAIVGQLNGTSDLANPLVEISASAPTSGLASSLLDLVIAALKPRHARTVVSVGSPPRQVVFGSIRLTDVQQSGATRPRAYRKAALFSIWQEV